MQNFWSHETRLPTGTLDRLVAMLEAMYTPGTETQYLSYSTNLLLEMTSKSPDFNRDVVEFPLSECKFEVLKLTSLFMIMPPIPNAIFIISCSFSQDYNVSSSWRQRHAAMTPLFVETQQTQAANASQSLETSLMDTQSTGQIRATQDVMQFSATQGIPG